MALPLPTGLQASLDGEQFRWACVYCLDPEPSGWLPATVDTINFLSAAERAHFAHHHAPADRKDEVLRDGIPHDLVQHALRDAAIAATEREQRAAKIALGITTEETTP